MYVLKEFGKDNFYIGYTINLKRRIIQHNMGETYSTKGRYWYIYCYFAFRSRHLAEDFEKYLKSHSGRSFSKKHFSYGLKNVVEKKLSRWSMGCRVSFPRPRYDKTNY